MRISARLLQRAACAAGVLGVLSTPVFAQTLRAAPQTVTIAPGQTSGKATIAWDAGAANPKAEVWFKVGNEDEERFSGEAKGTLAATILPGKTYTFTLYKDETGQDALATVVVTGKRAGEAAGGGVLAAPPGDDAAPVAGGNTASFTGTWNTVAGGGTPFTVTLEQTGNTLTGTYTPGNGKIFDGVVVGNKATFKWTQDGDWEGVGEWTLDSDGKGFIGTSTALKPRQFTHNWSVPRVRPSSFAGKWNTISAGQHGIFLILEQTGDKVTGTYVRGNGKLEGVVKGKILRFKWKSDGGEGSGRFVMNEGGRSFSGGWNKGDDPDEVDATWNGTRVTWFAGKWKGESRLTIAGQEELIIYTITLEQTGDRVKGQYTTSMSGGVAATIQEATVVGNTLKFTVVRADGTVFGDGEFVMNEGGKSFTGNIVALAVTGTYEGP